LKEKEKTPAYRLSYSMAEEKKILWWTDVMHIKYMLSISAIFMK
jgi:hypothetical protein